MYSVKTIVAAIVGMACVAAAVPTPGPAAGLTRRSFAEAGEYSLVSGKKKKDSTDNFKGLAVLKARGFDIETRDPEAEWEKIKRQEMPEKLHALLTRDEDVSFTLYLLRPMKRYLI